MYFLQFRAFTRKNTLRAVVTAVLLMLCAAAFPDDAFNNFYNNYFDFAEYFRDDNTGLTIFPILTIPTGGRYESMGTAFSAIADDQGFFDANPAGSSTLTYSELSVAHNAWIADTSIESINYTMRRGNLGAGFAGKFLYVPFTEYGNGAEPLNSIYYTEGSASINASYNFLKGFYFRGVSLGTNLKVAYRRIPEVIEENQSAVNVLGDFGLLTRFNLLKLYRGRDRNFAVSAVVKNLAPPIGEPTPAEATLGVGYKPFRPVTLAADFNYPFAFLTDNTPEKWNIAAGTDINIADFLSVQSGFHYKGGNPRFSLGSTFNLDYVRVNMNYTLGLDNQVSDALDRFSVTASLNLGDSGRFEVQQQVDEYYLAGLEAYAKGDYERALKLWESALMLDSSFEPAAENIIVVQETLSLQEQLRALNQVEE